MADFVLLYRGGGDMPDTEEGRKQAMDAWTSWFGSIGEAVKDGGNPFTEAAKRVGSDGSIEDLSGDLATGYSILQADSLDAATTLAKGCPVLQTGGEIEVYETFPVM